MTTATVVKPKVEPKLEVKPKVVIKKVQKEPETKTVLVEMTSPTPKVTFTGGLWTVMDVKLAISAMKVNFKRMLRELYRKEYKK